MRYYIADLHFFHGEMNAKMDRRGFESVEEMNEYMIRKWNGKVRKNDEVVVLGDLSGGTVAQTNGILRRLQGKLYLITGNHDWLIKKSGMDIHRFVWIKPYDEMSDNKRKVILCHYPMICYNGQYRLDGEGNPKTYMLYGHVHDSHDQRLLEQFQEIIRRTKITDAQGTERHIPCNMINCFCKYADYEPLTLDEWIVCDKERRKTLS